MLRLFAPEWGYDLVPCNINKLEHLVMMVSGCRLLSTPPVAKPHRLWAGWRWQEWCTLRQEGRSVCEHLGNAPSFGKFQYLFLWIIDMKCSSGFLKDIKNGIPEINLIALKLQPPFLATSARWVCCV